MQTIANFFSVIAKQSGIQLVGGRCIQPTSIEVKKEKKITAEFQLRKSAIGSINGQPSSLLKNQAHTEQQKIRGILSLLPSNALIKLFFAIKLQLPRISIYVSQRPSAFPYLWTYFENLKSFQGSTIVKIIVRWRFKPIFSNRKQRKKS